MLGRSGPFAHIWRELFRNYVLFLGTVTAVSTVATALAADAKPGSAPLQTDTTVSQHETKGDNAVTIDTLVRRVQIPVAALSPDGIHGAYMLVSADPLQNDYEICIKAIDLREPSRIFTLAQYRVRPDDAFSELGWFSTTGGDLRWLSDDELLFVSRVGGRAQLTSWRPTDQRMQIRLVGHDRIEIEAGSQQPQELRLVTTDHISPPIGDWKTPVDSSWRMRDGYSFYGPIRNPKQGSWVHRQRWWYPTSGVVDLRADGDPEEKWESAPVESTLPAPSLTKETQAWTTGETRTPDGARAAVLEVRDHNLTTPGASYSTFSILMKERESLRTLVPATRPYVLPFTGVLGWSGDEREVYYIYVTPQETQLNRVSVEGKVTTLIYAPELLSRPCPVGRSCQTISRDGRVALLVRSSNVLPGELVEVTLPDGAMTVLDSPNSVFSRAPHPEIRFYNVGGEGGDVWGRLYLPIQYQSGVRYPLVVTQYQSSPGFSSTTGDEVPILPLTEHGIAVLDMYSAALTQVSVSGDSRLEIERVRRPLRAMQRLVQNLVTEGIVDPERIGVSGLSYGAEIAMYSYWNWSRVRAVSASTGTWDPSLYFFSGTGLAPFLDRRGLRPMSAPGAEISRKLVAGLNARADLPPLLFQSPDGEQNATVPTWFRLRNAGAPVEWYEYPKEGHVKRFPANKWWVFERNLDWFRFWLKGEVDHDPAKDEQYARWRALESNVERGPDQVAMRARTDLRPLR